VKEIQPDLEAKNIWRGELELLGPIGDELPVSLVAIGHTQHDGHLESISCIARDISEQRRLHAQLEHQAAHDPLTGLANRRHFYGYLDGALARARRATNSVVVVFIDLDDFKHINDRFGHDAGDDLLVTVADRLRAKCRVGDFVARFGGDEFAILCEQIADEPAASHVGARVMEAFDEPVRIGDLSVSVSASVGVAVGERDATEPHDLVRRADQAMYEAKRFGQGGYRVAACPSR
jgi:diguanylate cyclase (GGDEF)-like protein